MENFLQFAIDNWYLFLVLMVLLMLIIYTEMSSNIAGIKFLSPQEVTNQINHSGAVMVDIRARDVFAKGHIIGSIGIPQNDFDNKVKKLQKYRNKPIIIVCGNGQHSPKYATKLRKLGFGQVLGLKGGVKAWEDGGYPLSKGNKAIK